MSNAIEIMMCTLPGADRDAADEIMRQVRRTSLIDEGQVLLLLTIGFRAGLKQGGPTSDQEAGQ